MERNIGSITWFLKEDDFYQNELGHFIRGGKEVKNSASDVWEINGKIFIKNRLKKQVTHKFDNLDAMADSIDESNKGPIFGWWTVYFPNFKRTPKKVL